MTQTHKAILLAATMFGIAFLAVFDIVPEEFAQWAPLAILAIFPKVWLGQSSRCSLTRSAK
ncbi:hypothetical protein GRI38_08615 [Altererythrobacter aurantiacus]|uniref:Uncharacterized protein n=1 Tax=Parapontixanthobacter aurantiacus TaxID=1463599 RepID=A0A844ZE84_9SPHN|nr:hypothetical protein [Parapontixanthobacter aurantiacus]MXO86088.1 hypothetical protein [Parapontixanthobacter aurantiacus]